MVPVEGPEVESRFHRRGPAILVERHEPQRQARAGLAVALHRPEGPGETLRLGIASSGRWCRCREEESAESRTSDCGRAVRRSTRRTARRSVSSPRDRPTGMLDGADVERPADVARFVVAHRAPYGPRSARCGDPRQPVLRHARKKGKGSQVSLVERLLELEEEREEKHAAPARSRRNARDRRTAARRRSTCRCPGPTDRRGSERAGTGACTAGQGEALRATGRTRGRGSAPTARLSSSATRRWGRGATRVTTSPPKNATSRRGGETRRRALVLAAMPLEDRTQNSPARLGLGAVDLEERPSAELEGVSRAPREHDRQCGDDLGRVERAPILPRTQPPAGRARESGRARGESGPRMRARPSPSCRRGHPCEARPSRPNL